MSRATAVTINCEDISGAFPELELVRELGDGTFKVACLARNGEEEVVLKVVKEPISEPDANLPERLRREIEGMKKINDPHVAKVLEGPSTRQIAGAERVFYLEPFYSGGTLEDKLGEPWDVAAVLELGVGLLAGVSALEAAGIVHRDIKPANIAFDADGRPVLLDLGIAYFVDLTAITEPFGGSPKTPLWAAPEQFEMRSTVVIDSRTDLFQVGMVCFKAATGSHPFEPADNGYMERLTTGGINTAALQAASLPSDLDQIFRRLLEPAPNRRYRKPGIAMKAFKDVA